MSKLHPRLIVTGADEAIAFYLEAFEEARVVERYADGDLVVHAAIAIGDDVFALAEGSPDFDNYPPESLGGSAVIMTLTVDDPDGVAARMVSLGAEVVFPIADQFYGHREGRLRDPFGHLWILSKVVEDLEPEEIQRRMAKLFG